MTLQEFMNKYRGTEISVPWGYKGECVSLAQMYVHEVFGLPLYRSNGNVWARGNGVDFGNTLIREGVAHEVQDAQYGDLLIWGGFEGYGHVGIRTEKGMVFDQTTGQRRYAENRQQLPNVIQIVRMIKPLPSESKLIAEKDTYVITEPDGMRLRSTPFVKSDNIVGGIAKGKEFNYTHKIESDGYMWVYDGNNYVARRKLDDTETYGYIKSVGQDSKPSTPKLNEYNQAVFAGSDIQFSMIYTTPNSSEALTPYHKNDLGRGYGKVNKVLSNVSNPYEIIRNGVVIGYVRPVNTF